MNISFFDAKWYLSQYPDVAAAGVDPYQHYLKFGKKEGRWPCFLPALDLENHLWQAENPQSFIELLQALLDDEQLFNQGLAAWALARWFASLGQWQQASLLLPKLLTNDTALTLVGHQGPYLLAFLVFVHIEDRASAAKLLVDSRWPNTNDKILAETMLLQGEQKLSVLNQIFAQNKLLPLRLNQQPMLENLSCETVRSNWKQFFKPVVTVIVPCFNSEKTIATALNSLLKQTYSNLQILVADDCSTDHSTSIVKQFAALDKRITLVTLEKNSGAYVARNTALKFAKGKFITTHDADDWSHPQKIELQVNALLKNKAAMASASHWVRTSVDLSFQRWRTEDCWIFRNVSSLMFRRSVVKTLGYWDRVSVNADTEFYYRILQQYGVKSIVEVLPGVPLSFGRADEGSLSRTTATHLRTQFRGLRKDHMAAALAWQTTAESLYMSDEPKSRFFPVPPLMCRGTEQQKQHNLVLLLTQKACFDAQWYLRRYPDVAAAGIDPMLHFVKFGAKEGRDPLPTFSLSGYAYANGLSFEQVLPTWLSEAEPLLEPTSLVGHCSKKERAKTLLCVGHSASAGLFGAERSFLDVLSVLQQQALNLVVVLPDAACPEYLTSVLAKCQHVVILPYQWWHLARQMEQTTIDAFANIMTTYAISRVYVNTLVLAEPILAAKQCEIACVVHVHELPEYDVALCESLGASPTEILAFIHANADYFIANSNATAKWIMSPERTVIIPNILDSTFLELAETLQSSTLEVVMLSSNLAKKGVLDAVEVAQRCATAKLNIIFKLYGPVTPLVTELTAQGLPANLTFCGYVDDARAAIMRANIVLNLSHFQESFGRTVQEAMALGKVALVYDWGALGELVQPDRGVIVPFRDIDAVVNALQQLSLNPEHRFTLGKNAHTFIADYCNETAVTKKLLSALHIV